MESRQSPPLAKELTSNGNFELVGTNALHQVFSDTDPDLFIYHVQVLNNQVHIPALFTCMYQPIQKAGTMFVLKAASIEPRAQFIKHQDTVFFLIIGIWITVASSIKIGSSGLIRDTNNSSAGRMRQKMIKPQINVARHALASQERLTNLADNVFTLA